MSPGHLVYRSTDPATGTVHEEVPTVTDSALAEIVAAGHAAYLAWRETDLHTRAGVLRAAAKGFRDRVDELAEVVTREMGKPHAAAAGELGLVADIFDYYADSGPGMLADEEFVPASGGLAIVQKRPVGLVLGIMPWNYPHYQIARLAAPNLLLGNGILLKPAPSCPVSARLFASVLDDAGLPAGVYSTVYADNEQVATLVADPRVQGVSLTGSERAGAAVAEIAGRHLKKVVLELGGSDPMLVLDADDPRAVARAAYSSRMANLGQACNSPKRMIVLDEVYDDFVAALVELAGGAEGLPPLSSSAAAEGVEGQVRAAVEAGATLHVGGARSGAFFSPAVLTGLDPSSPAARQEIFGPALVVYRAADEDEAVALANDSDYGLGASVFCSDRDRARAVAERLDCGMVFINGAPDSEPDLPFGGIKRSGIGRELGRFGLEEFANHRLIRLPA